MSACREVIVEITGVSFVDDSSMSVTSEYIPDPNLSDAENAFKEVEHLSKGYASSVNIGSAYCLPQAVPSIFKRVIGTS